MADRDDKAAKPGRGAVWRAVFRRPKFTTLAGSVLLIAAAVLRMQDPVMVEQMRLKVFDFYQRQLPRAVDEASKVTIVDIDDRSMAKLGQWPWPRTLVGDLIDRIGGAGAKVIGLDIIFSEPDRMSPAKVADSIPMLDAETAARLRQLPSNDAVFAEALKRYKVVGARIPDYSGELGRNPLKRLSTPGVKALKNGVDAETVKLALNQMPPMLGNVPEIETSAAGHGLIVPETDGDGVFRRVPLYVMSQNAMQPALTTEMLRIGWGRPNLLLETDVSGVSRVLLSKSGYIPTDYKARLLVHFSEPNAGRYVSAVDVLEGRVPVERFKDRYVLVGTSAVGLRDVRNTPVDGEMPGVEIHANIIETVLSESYLSYSSEFEVYEIAALLGFGIVFILVVPQVGWMWALALGGLVVLGLAGTSLTLYTQQKLLFDVSYTILVLTSLYFLLVFSSYAREAREKRQVRAAFGQYLSPALVEQLAQNPDKLRLGGETKDLTMLFCDVRGFTTISEQFKTNPQGLTALMNRFLTPLTDQILARKGTIDKYMGDCIMAFWNAPLDVPNHAAEACGAALAMLEALEELNQVRRKEAEAEGTPYLPLAIGIGLNSGDVVVGNMGSDQRFDYSVLGDAVNLASRLEGQSKNYGVNIVIGPHTAEMVAGRYAVLELDLIAVKGKKEAVRIFTVVGDQAWCNSPEFKAWAADHDGLIAAYRSQRWNEAERLIAACRERSGGRIAGFYDMMAGRIAQFRKDPPPAEWDGVYVAKDK
ncbi:MAG TPA: adenylate/guanylate cyclase domain-containing protein [Alphaproteobacteria bacterium]|nr:adenylate/guanylate cyclase domain-containing protein [Alphaproteobacteria bacterium]